MVDSEPTERTHSIESSQSSESSAEAGTEAASEQPRGRRHWRQGPVEDNAGWAIFSYLISGMVAYGLIGWLVAWLTHIAILLPLGALAGLVMAIVLIILKYGRP